MSDARRHARVSEVFLSICDLDREAQAAALARACGTDAEIRAEVEALLREDARCDGCVRPDGGRGAGEGLAGGVRGVGTGSSIVAGLASGRDEQAGAVRGLASDRLVSDWTGADRAGLDGSGSGGAGSESAGSAVGGSFPVVAGYRVEGVLGQGGMGIVYRAVQLGLNRSVALKVLPEVVGAANPELVARFRREAAAAARLKHRHIVPIYDFGQSVGGYYYAMELVRGASLSEWVRILKGEGEGAGSAVGRLEGAVAVPEPGEADRPFAPGYFRLVAGWVRDAAEALAFAHGVGVIHRDVKPGNLMLSAEGRVLLTDFGLAVSDQQETITRTGSLMGTLRYLSPEQALGGRVPVDARTDVYSLGATLYELLTLRPVFEGVAGHELLAAVIGRSPTAPRKVNPQVPRDLETICVRAMEKMPSERYGSAEAMAGDLAAFVEGRAISASRVGVAARARRFVGRRRRAILVGGLIVAMVSAASLLAGGVLRARRDARVGELLSTALVAQRDQRWADASDWYERALAMDPRNVKALGNLAIVRKEQFNETPGGDAAFLAEAVGYCDRALAEDADNAGLWNLRGVLWKKQGAFGPAGEAYERALAVEGASPIVRVAAMNNLAEVYLLSGREVLAAETTELAARTAEEAGVAAWFAWRDLASLYWLEGDERAVGAIARGFSDKKEPNWSLYLVRARIFLDFESVRDVSRALRDAESALEQGSNDPRVARVAARAMLRTGDLAGAAEQAEAAIAGGDVEAYGRLILAIEAGLRGDGVERVRQMERAAEVWPEAFDQREYLVSTERGVLWFDTRWLLKSLWKEADSLE